MKKTKQILEGTTVVKISKQNVQIGISPLVSRHCGQTGCQKEQKTSRNSNFWGWCTTFQSKLKNLQKRRKLSQKHEKKRQFWVVFRICAILTEKQRTKPKNLSSLKFSASFDTQLAPSGARLVEIFFFEHFVFENLTTVVPSRIFFYFLQNKV